MHVHVHYSDKSNRELLCKYNVLGIIMGDQQNQHQVESSSLLKTTTQTIKNCIKIGND